ncbi:hypothetical protein DPMN_194262 [Dreissena polymorpha]|uniref:Zinc finger PHD-type domain-containing protein n=1 Tax=Dreissena polymorpha TaxID=45954 RepID=A0A9D3Y513_DREPO|nr:hypothetical protein DPMN_194262 [Dreissena polymorpha]
MPLLARRPCLFFLMVTSPMLISPSLNGETITRLNALFFHHILPILHSYSECQSFLRQNPGLNITRYNIGSLSSKAYNKAMTPENLISSFRKTGIYPLNPSVIPAVKTAPSKIYSANECLHPVASSPSCSFLESRKIKTATTNPRKRKAPETIVGDLSKYSNKLSELPNVSAQSKHNQPAPEPSTSSSMIIPTDEDSDEHEEKDLCCICKQFQPESLHLDYVLDIVQWAECSECQHWVHLKYCDKVKCVRRGADFKCPHCDPSTFIVES